MGLKEELEEKAESCDSPEEYIGVAKEIATGLDDKDWAVELMEEKPQPKDKRDDRPGQD